MHGAYGTKDVIAKNKKAASRFLGAVFLFVHYFLTGSHVRLNFQNSKS